MHGRSWLILYGNIDLTGGTMSLNTIESVKEYYGNILKTNKDLKTSACCPLEALPNHVQEPLKNIHPEVIEKFYGCGSPIPYGLKNKTVLDLGCGSGRDCYILSQLVGEKGKVVGVDMTKSQLEVALKHQEYHAKKFGHPQSNITFKQAYIEDLEAIGIETNSVDCITSNCVINLSPDKKRVFKEAFRVLKEGGELIFSDVFSDRRLPTHMKSDPILLGECLGGALYIEDFRRILLELGCSDYRIVNQRKIEVQDKEIKNKIGLINFYSMTIRAFKLHLEDRCEDFGQVAYYLGNIAETPNYFVLDDHHLFESNKAYPVCSNTADILSKTRYSEYFKVIGNTNSHFGLFDCSTKKENETSGACC